MGSHPVPIYAKTINKNAPKRSARAENESRINAAVAGKAAISDIFLKSLAKDATKPLMAMQRVYEGELCEILERANSESRALTPTEKKRLRLIKMQLKGIAHGMSVAHVLLGL